MILQDLIKVRRKKLVNLIGCAMALLIFAGMLLLNVQAIYGKEVLRSRGINMFPYYRYKGSYYALKNADIDIQKNSSPEVIAKPVSADNQIVKATSSVITAEKIVSISNFNPLVAQNQLYLATLEVLKIKSFGKTYDNNYKSLANRITVIKNKIMNRKLVINSYAQLVLEADNAVTKAEKFIHNENINMVANASDLVTAQDSLTAALEAVSKLDKTTEVYKNLMNKIDALNTIIIGAMDDVPALKPVIYLYPSITQNINVKIDERITLSCSYPKYSKTGWNVTAYPNGTIVD
jgi:hypothetical protein